jgi:hypothetical protein
MARLVYWPNGLGIASLDVLSGPRTIGQASNTSIGNFNQTVSSPFGLWRFQMSFAGMKGQWARRFRGWITSLHGGANATTFKIYDFDGLTNEQAGITGNFQDQIWSNDETWSNGKPWGKSFPFVGVGASALKGATIIALNNQYWSNNLEVGDFIGFTPLHFGLYIITEKTASNTYRVWPPLRKALTTDDKATLTPTMALRLESEDSASLGSSVNGAQGLTATFVEVLHDDVITSFS